MCSSTFGPAIAPSLLTCPTSITGTPQALACLVIISAHSLTCDTLPGEELTESLLMVWIESTITTSGLT